MVVPVYQITVVGHGGSNFLDEFIRSSNYYLRYTVTTSKGGGRGLYYRNLLTAEIPREIQHIFSDAVRKLIARSSDSDLQSIADENRFFTKDMADTIISDGDVCQRSGELEDNIEHVMSIVAAMFADPDNVSWDSNIVDDRWTREEFKRIPLDDEGNVELGDAFQDDTEKGRVFSFNSIGIIKLFIQEYMRPQKYSFFVIVSMLDNLGISLNNCYNSESASPNMHFLDKVPMRLYIMARVYLGEVLSNYLSDKKESVLLALESRSKLVFHRGNSLGSLGRSRRQVGR
jgi:hypothetical protein